MLNNNKISTPRDAIWAILEAAETWVSGEAISLQLGISRAAVGKHVTALRNDGHAIEAFTRKGYRLLAKRDALDGELLAASLRTRVFGKVGWTFLETTTSTNLQAVHLVEEGALEGHVVVAERQTKGRGRKGHDWFPLPRSIQFSVLLYPQSSCWDMEGFTRLGAHAVAGAVKEVTGLDAVFKMPNDVLIGEKKIAGILVETGYRGNQLEWAVIGIGCNVNVLPDEFPEDARGKITSIIAEAGCPVSRISLLVAFLEKIETAYANMCKG